MIGKEKLCKRSGWAQGLSGGVAGCSLVREVLA
jgi:hypothetical protein